MILPYIWKETLKGVPQNKSSLKLGKFHVMQKEDDIHYRRSTSP